MKLKPEILVIIDYYLPGTHAGGPIRTTSNMVSWLGDDFSFKILTSDHDLNSSLPYPGIQQGGWQAVGKAQVRYLSAAEQSIGNLRHILKNTSYDMVYLDGAFASLTLKTLLLRKLKQIPSCPAVLAPRGHLNRSALNLKPLKKRNFLRLTRLIGLYDRLTWHVSNLAEKADLQHGLNVADHTRICTIPNLPSPLLQNAERSERLKSPGIAQFIFLSRIARVKNLHFALEQLQVLRGKVRFDIYGVLEDRSYWQECEAIIDRLPDNITVTRQREVSFEDVIAVFSDYHLFIFPTLGENFGHVILESLCAGCPVLISDQTPWSSVNESGGGWVFPLNQPEKFAAVAQQMVDMSDHEFSEMVRCARKYGQSYIKDTALIDRMLLFFQNMLS